MRRVIKASAALAATAALIIPGAAAQAQLNTADTEITFTLLSGPLTITAPIVASLLQDAAGEPTVSGLIPLVTVSDLRVGSTPWTTTAAVNDFVAVLGEGTDTIGKDKVTYTPTLVVPVGATVANSGPVTLNTTKNVVWTTNVSLLTNVTTWTGNIAVDVSAASSLNPYTSTLTHSVA